MAFCDLPSILIVDDDREFRQSLAKIFQKAGFSVSVAGDGGQASELLGKAYYPLIVLDLKMPGKSGLEVLREIKAQTPEAKVIMVTAFADPDSIQRALNAGAFAYLNKPVKREDILASVKKALELSVPRSEDEVV